MKRSSLLILYLWIACGAGIRAQSTGFPLPSVPDSITTAEVRMKYLCAHFWDHYDFKDLKPLQTPRVILHYIQLLSNIPDKQAVTHLSVLMDRAITNQTVFEQLVFLFDRYLYSADSKFQNEELYLPILEYVIRSPKVDSVYKIYPQAQLRLARQNRVGRCANDFLFTLTDGSMQNLYGIESPYILLYFNNPDCSVCKATKKAIEESSVIKTMQQQGKLRIIAIYPGDNVELWKQTLYPASWVNGYDKNGTIYSEWLYALKMMPALYLLDKDKNVLIKERPFADVERYIIHGSKRTRPILQ